jgi:hypothetical protein
MDTATIIAENWKQNVIVSIAALRGSRITFTKGTKRPDGRKRPHSAETRRKLSHATKKRWAEWREKKAAA